jgi:hypothetical protein
VGGWTLWEALGLPVEKKPSAISDQPSP